MPLSFTKLFKALMSVYLMHAVDPGDPSDPPPNPNPKPAPQTFSAEYVHELREENKAWRLKAQTAETKAADLQKAADTAAQSAKDSVAAAEKAANERVMRAEVKAAAIAAGMIDLDGLKLADMSKLTLKDDGSVEGVDTMLTEFKTAKPYLFGKPNSSSNPSDPPPNKPPEAKKATEMTEAEYATAKQQLLKN